MSFPSMVPCNRGCKILVDFMVQDTCRFHGARYLSISWSSLASDSSCTSKVPSDSDPPRRGLLHFAHTGRPLDPAKIVSQEESDIVGAANSSQGDFHTSRQPGFQKIHCGRRGTDVIVFVVQKIKRIVGHGDLHYASRCQSGLH